MKITFLIYLLVFPFYMEAQLSEGVFKIQSVYAPSAKCPHYVAGDPNTNSSEFGTGFLFQGKYIITAYHTIPFLCEPTINVISPDGALYTANISKVIGMETLLDIAVLKLDRPPKNLTSYNVFATEHPYKGMPVVVNGYFPNTTFPKQLETTIQAMDVSIPYSLGSHKLSCSTTSTLPAGFSGGPVLYKEKIVGMVVGRNPINGEGYFLEGNILQKALQYIVNEGYQTVPRLYTGTVWKESPNGIQLIDVLDSGDLALKEYIGEVVHRIEEYEIQDLSDLRTAFERLGYKPNQQLTITFDNGRRFKSPTISTIQLNENHFADISNYYMSKNYLPFTFRTHQGQAYKKEKLIIADGDSYKILSGYTLNHIWIKDFPEGLQCDDLFDLGRILKIFGTLPIAKTKIHFSFSDLRGKTVYKSLKMPALLIN